MMEKRREEGAGSAFFIAQKASDIPQYWEYIGIRPVLAEA